MGKCDRGNGRDGSWHGMGRGRKGKEEGEGKGGEGLQPPNFNSWRRHWAQPVCRSVVRGTDPVVWNSLPDNIRDPCRRSQTLIANVSVLAILVSLANWGLDANKSLAVSRYKAQRLLTC